MGRFVKSPLHLSLPGLWRMEAGRRRPLGQLGWLDVLAGQGVLESGAQALEGLHEIWVEVIRKMVTVEERGRLAT